MRKYDYLIVGAGLFGSIVAYELNKRNYKVLVVDRRNYIGGNCHTRKINGIHVHLHGPHIFHTDNKFVWNYINNFAEFNGFTYRPKAKYGDKLYSLPINLHTMYELWGVTSPDEARRKLEEVKIDIPEPRNLEEYVFRK